MWQETKQAIKNLKWFILLASLALILLFVFPHVFDIQEMGINETPETASQKIRPTPIDSEGSPSTISTEPNLNLSENTGLTDKADFTEEQAYYQKEWVWVILLSLPLLAVLLWYFWQRYQAQPYLTRKSTSQTPNIKQFFTKNINEALFQSVGLARVAQQLRKHRPIATDYLDLKATIKDTIKAGGWFTPVTGIAKTIPEYLVLIDRTTFKDHHSHLIDALVNQLIAQGIFIARYYFDSDPRHCYPENDELPPLLLTELADHDPAHRLLIFSDGKGFIDPMTSDIVPWIEQFSVWTQKIFFTLEQPEQGGYQALLEKANFLVMPANENGLTTLAEQIKAETWQPDMPHPKKTTEPVSTFPSYFNELSQWWLKRHAPARAKITELLKQVQDFLGEDGYYWFSACAVYPELRWHLTVYLGYNLKTSDGNKLLTNDRLAKLASLPWFRYGYMPNWLRRRLVNDLSLPQENKVRFALKTLLEEASKEPISDFQLEIASSQKNTFSVKEIPSALKQWLSSKWKKQAPKESLRDYVFLSFMENRLSIKIPKMLRSVLIQSSTQLKYFSLFLANSFLSIKQFTSNKIVKILNILRTLFIQFSTQLNSFSLFLLNSFFSIKRLADNKNFMFFMLISGFLVLIAGLVMLIQWHREHLAILVGLWIFLWFINNLVKYDVFSQLIEKKGEKNFLYILTNLWRIFLKDGFLLALAIVVISLILGSLEQPNNEKELARINATVAYVDNINGPRSAFSLKRNGQERFFYRGFLLKTGDEISVLKPTFENKEVYITIVFNSSGITLKYEDTKSKPYQVGFLPYRSRLDALIDAMIGMIDLIKPLFISESRGISRPTR